MELIFIAAGIAVFVGVGIVARTPKPSQQSGLNAEHVVLMRDRYTDMLKEVMAESERRREDLVAAKRDAYEAQQELKALQATLGTQVVGANES